MTKDRWLEIKDLIKEKFGINDEDAENYDEQGGVVVEWLEFNGPLGLMRLEYETKPVILDKKTHGSNRIGSEATVQYIYSPTEKTAKLYAYRFDKARDDWQEIDLTELSFA
jgi:hypothetical protein